jgi:hypothetical protein
MPPAKKSVESVESVESVGSVESVRLLEPLMSLLMSEAMDDVRDDVRDDDATEPLRWSLLRKSASGENLSALQSATTSGVSSSEGAGWGATAEHELRERHEHHEHHELSEPAKCSHPTLCPSSSPGRGEESRGHRARRAHLSTPTRPLA